MELRETNPTDESSPRQEAQKTAPWKLICFCIVFVLIFVLCVFYPPARKVFFRIQYYLQGQGWYGSLGLCIIASCVVVPFGIPYSMVQMMFAIMIPEYWLALLLTSVSQTLGSIIAYCIMKFMFREKLTKWGKSQTIFRGIDLILSRSPLKFSIILNLTNLPLIIKNYALALPECVGFNIFTMSSIIGAVFTSAPQIYLFQQAEDFDSLFDHTKNPLTTAFTVASTLLSIGIILYFAWYTKKILNDIHKEVKALQPAELKEVVQEGMVKIDIKPEDQIEEEVNKVQAEEVLGGRQNEASYKSEISGM